MSETKLTAAMFEALKSVSASPGKSVGFWCGPDGFSYATFNRLAAGGFVELRAAHVLDVSSKRRTAYPTDAGRAALSEGDKP